MHIVILGLLVSLLGLSLSACMGGAQMVLKSPIQDQCTSAGLKGCDQISEGATLYADGNDVEGEQKLGAGLRANVDKVAELKKFADGLELVGKLPGAGQYVAPMQPAIRLVQRVAAEAAERQLRQKAEPLPAQSATVDAQVAAVVASDPQPPRLAQPVLAVPRPAKTAPIQTTFWQFSGNNQVTQCRFPGTPKMVCIQEVTQARKIVTDVMVSTACPADVLIASRHRLNFDWLVYAPAGKGAEVHGATLPLDEKHSITVALAPKNDESMLDIRCGVTTAWHFDVEYPSGTPANFAPSKTPGAAAFSLDGI